MKLVFPPIPIGAGRIRIASMDLGIASELEDDEQGNTWRLMELMDGTRTVPELLAGMRGENRDVTLTDVEDAVAALGDAGFAEDAAIPPPDSLSPAELERYRRNLEFFSYFHRPPATSYDFQRRLQGARVTLLGLGGLGSFVAMSLAAIGVGDILLVDYDRVELMNLNRQILYTDRDIGRLKTDASADRLSLINPHVTITTLNTMVDGVDAARAIMAGRDLIICAADRPRIQLYQWLNEAALAEGIAWVRGSQSGLTVNLMMHIPQESACFQCAEQDALAKFPWYGPSQRYFMDVIGDRTVNPCMAPLAGMIGNLAALEAVKYLTGMAEPVIRGRMLFIDLLRMNTEFAEPGRLADCTACGSAVAPAVSA
ncbi:ThiF family adenylyltransferase [Nonomuraea sp. MTCD27]|uniref:HesA/MoeB/ThiF family protein n=1 Tax=Nonomuraea sp. MTCD27 TaxID=1676747 RepID=UPI0035BFDADF